MSEKVRKEIEIQVRQINRDLQSVVDNSNYLYA